MTAVMGIFPFACYWTFGVEKTVTCTRSVTMSDVMMSDVMGWVWLFPSHLHSKWKINTLSFLCWIDFFLIIHPCLITITLMQQQWQRRWGENVRHVAPQDVLALAWSSQRIWMKVRSQDWREGEVMLETKTKDEGCRPERKLLHVKVFTSYNNTTLTGSNEVIWVNIMVFLCMFM